MKDSLTDEELLQAMKGDREERDRALRKFFFDDPFYRNWIRDFVLRLNGTAEDAREVFQVALIDFDKYTSKDSFKGLKTSAVRTYFLEIAKHKWFDLYRKKKPMLDLKEADFEISESPPDVEEFSEEEVQVLNFGLQHLDARCRDMLMAKYIDGLSMKQIAEKFGFHRERRAINQMARCKEYLKSKMKKHSLFAPSFKWKK